MAICFYKTVLLAHSPLPPHCIAKQMALHSSKQHYEQAIPRTTCSEENADAQMMLLL